MRTAGELSIRTQVLTALGDQTVQMPTATPTEVPDGYRPPPRRRLRPEPPRTVSDVIVGLGLLLGDGIGFLYCCLPMAFTDLAPSTPAQLQQGEAASQHRILVIIGIALVITLVAAFLRARWTASLQLVGTVLLGLAFLSNLVFSPDNQPPAPAPTPSAYSYSPCYSGSGTCQ